MTIRRLGVPVTLLVSGFVVVVVVLPWADLFVTTVSGGSAVPVVVIGGLGATVISGVLAGLGRRFAMSISLSVGAFLLICLSIVVRPALSLSAFIDGYTQALDRGLTSTPPLLVAGGVLVPLLTLVWLVAAANAELIVRTRVVGGLLVGPALLLIVSQAVATRPSVSVVGSAQQPWLPLAVLALLAILVLLRYQSLDAARIVSPSVSEQRAMRVAPVVGVALVIVAASMVIVLGNRVVALDSEANLGVEPSVLSVEVAGPLETFAAIRDPSTEFGGRYVDVSGPVTLLRVATTQPTAGYFTIAALTDFDGASWDLPASSLFGPIGFRLPPNAPSGRSLVDQDYEVVVELPSDQPWLVAINQPTDVLEGPDAPGYPAVLADREGRILRASQPLARGDRYSIRSLQLSTTLDKLDNSFDVVGGAPLPDQSTRQLSAGSVSRVVERWRDVVEGSPASGGLRLGADRQSLSSILDYLNGVPINPVSSDSTVGSSVALSALDASFGLESQSGSATPEQIASQFALLARSIGVPSRIAVGFRKDTGESPDLPTGTHDLTSADLWAWAEVFVGDAGWVIVDLEAVDPDDGNEGGGSPTGQESRVGEVPGGSGEVTVVPPESIPDQSVERSWGMAAVLASLVIMTGVTVFVLSRRPLRRARRRRGDPVHVISGAWNEMLDTLGEHSVPGLEYSGSEEVISRTRERFGDSVAGPVGNVAVLAAPAVFSSQAMTDEQARLAWQNLAAARKALRYQLNLRQRIAGVMRAAIPRRGFPG